MTGTRIHGYLITASRRKEIGIGKHEYQTVFIYEDTSGKFIWSDKIDDGIAFQSWTGRPGALDSIENAEKELKMKNFRVREFWHTLS